MPQSQAQVTITFREARQAYLDDMRRQVVLGAKSPNTLWTYEKRTGFFEQEMGLADVPLQDVDRPTVMQYLTRLREGRLPNSRKPASDNYVDNHWRHLNGMLQALRRRGYSLHPSLFEEGRGGAKVLSIPEPIVDEGEMKAWTDDEISAIREAAKDMGRHDKAAGALATLIVELLLRTGVRLQELANIRLDDIQGEAIRIGKSKSTRGRRTRTFRWVPLYPEPRRMVAAWLDKYRPQTTDEHLLISPRTSQPLTPAGIQSLLKRIDAKAGAGASPHRYRHTFGIGYLRKNRGQIKQLKDYLGHADFRTVEIYAKIAKQDITIDTEDPFA